MLKSRIAGFGVVAVLGSGSALAQGTATDQTTMINKAVVHCVNLVHNTHSQEQYMQMFYTNFDAFYNPSTGNIQNNAQSNGDMKALFVFNKCMAEQGFALK